MKVKTVLITGGNKGIGLEITGCFINEGFKLYVASRDPHNYIKNLEIMLLL